MTGADLRYYCSVLWSRLLYLLAFCAVGMLIGGGLAYMQRPVYKAKAQILVESPQIASSLARSTVSENAIAQVEIIKQELITRDALLALADQFDIYSDDAAKQGSKALTPADIVDDMRERIAIEQTSLGGSDSSATAFTVSFEARNPVLSAQVTNALVDAILRKDTERRSLRAGETLQFFQQDVTRLGTQLSALDAKLLAFKNQNVNALPDSLDFRRARQGNQEERSLLLEREEATLRSRRANLVLMFQQRGLGADGQEQTPQGKLLADYKSALASQSAVFAGDSPAIIALRSSIAALEQGLSTAEASPKGEGVAVRSGPMTDLDIQLVDIDDRLASIGKEKAEIAASIASLDTSIQATPENETALTILERDRDTVQVLQSAAMARLEEASTGEQIEALLKGERLSLIETALPPQDPLPSKKFILVIAGTMGGLALGIGLIVALQLLDRRVRRPVELRRKLNMEPMLTIAYLPNGSEVWGKRAVGFSCAALIVGALWALPFVATSFNLPLPGVVNTVLGRSDVKLATASLTSVPLPQAAQ